MALEIQTEKSLAVAPLLGAAMGAVAAILYGYTGALVAVLFWTAVSRLIGEPSLHPAIAVLGVLFAWQLLRTAVEVHDPFIVCIAAQAVSRAASIALAWVSRPSADPPRYTRSLTSGAAIVAITLGVVATFLAGWLPGVLILLATNLVTRLLRVWAYRSRGGVNQEVLAYARVVVELCVLLALSVPLPAGFPMYGTR